MGKSRLYKSDPECQRLKPEHLSFLCCVLGVYYVGAFLMLFVYFNKILICFYQGLSPRRWDGVWVEEETSEGLF